MSFGDHLDELRKRLMLALLVPVPVFCFFLYGGNWLLDWTTAPLIKSLKAAKQPAVLQTTSPTEAFTEYVQIAMVATAVVSLPWMLYQFWKFIAPGLYAKEKRFVFFLVPLSTILTTIGLAILYWVLLPLSLYFLIEFGATLVTQKVETAPLPPGITLPSVPILEKDPPDPQPGQYWFNKSLQQSRLCIGTGEILGQPMQSGASIIQQYRLSEYIDLVFMLGLSFAIAAQLPLVLMLLSWIGVINYKMLAKYRRHAIFGSVFLGALLPTQDPGSLIMLGAMLYSLFELGLILMRFVPASRVASGVFKSGAAPGAATPPSAPSASPPPVATWRPPSNPPFAASPPPPSPEAPPAAPTDKTGDGHLGDE